MVLKGLKSTSYKKKDAYILSPVRSHGQNSKPKDNNPAERIKASPKA